jgi:hypothetical protein
MRQVKRHVLLVVLLALCAVSSCTYTYIPPVPRGRVEPDPTLNLHTSAGIVTEMVAGTERLVLQLTASDVPEADWLAVQWFAPNNLQVASASQWLEPSREPQDLRFVLSEDVTLRPGDWRAVVSYQSRVARQFSLPLAAETEPDADPDADTDTGIDTEADEDAEADSKTEIETDSALETPATTPPEAPSSETPATSPATAD